MSAPLKLYWWDAKPNFGDAISAIVTAHVAGREVVHAAPKEADLFALGSILQIVRRTHKAPRADGSKPWIWGAGTLKPTRTDYLDHVRFAAVRGPITAAILGLPVHSFGDPGILIADALGPVPERRDRIAVVPHLAQLRNPALRALAEAEPRIDLIDVRGDPVEVCRRIGSAAHVISSSLHGLVTADAYGVPNTWLDPTGNHDAPELKFYDYAAGIGRALPRPITHAEIPDLLPRLPQGPLPYAETVRASQEALRDAFPRELATEKAA